MKKRYRYPGSKPFDSSEQDIFFGREQDITVLSKFIELEQSVVIYGKSGIGKSSLIEAGIIPEILKKGNYHSIRIRFGAYTKGKTETPVQIARDTINVEEDTWLKSIQTETEQSLWYTIKNRQIQEKHKGYLLVFDQFEELFTYPDELVKGFARQLAEILYTNIPERYRQGIETGFSKNDNFLSDAQMQELHQPIDLKILMGIRSDRMSLMNKLKPFLPVVLLHTHEILPLTRLQAEDAILSPAYKEHKKFASKRFDFDDNALDAILDFLTHENTQNVESFQLQILCHHIEQIIIDEKDKKKVSIFDIEDIPSIYQNYYLDQIKRLGSKSNQIAARRLIEDGLIYEEEERRLSLYESQIYKYYDISKKLLSRLVDTHIIRAEPSMRGGYTYELSHDTLVAPALRAKRKGIIGGDEEKTTKNKNIPPIKTRQYALIDLLTAFSKKELRGLTQFVESQYFNTDPYLAAFLNALKNEVIHKDNFDTDKQVVFYRMAFPERPPVDELNMKEKRQLNIKMVNLLRITEDFLRQIALKEHPVYYDELLYKKLFEKKLFSLLDRRIKRGRRIQQGDPKGIDYYENRLKAEELAVSLSFYNWRFSILDSLEEVNKNLDIYYIVKKLNVELNFMFYSQYIDNKTYDLSLFETIKPLILEYKEYPIVKIYQIANDLLKIGDIETYDSFFEILKVSKDIIEGRFLYVLAINFCTQQIRLGNLDYNRKLFELYILMDERNLVVHDDNLHINQLRNMVITCCKSKEYGRAEQFIEKYTPFIPTLNRESLYSFNLGYIAFSKAQYRKAIQHFTQSENVDVNFNLLNRSMLLKSYYELDSEYNEDTLRRIILTVTYIRKRKTIIPTDIKSYDIFIDILGELYQIRHSVSEKSLEKLEDKLNNTELVYDKKWLSEKIEELKKHND